MAPVTNADAKGPRITHRYTADTFDWGSFFDPAYVKEVMKTAKSFKDLDSGYDGVYLQWERNSKGRPVFESMQALEEHPQKEGIKRAHDLQHLWEFWLKHQAGVVRPSIHPKQAERYTGWNKWSEQQCQWIKNANGIKRNPFKESCIIPDWRSPRQIKADNKALIAIGKKPE